MDLTTAAGLEAFACEVAELLGGQRAGPGESPDRVCIAYADGRVLELAFNRPPSTHVTISAILPYLARTRGIEVPPITVCLPVRSRRGRPGAKTPAQFVADQIRWRVEQPHTVALAELGSRAAPDEPWSPTD